MDNAMTRRVTLRRIGKLELPCGTIPDKGTVEVYRWVAELIVQVDPSGWQEVIKS